MDKQTQTTKKLTSIFPVGFEGNTTEIATEEDNKRMEAIKTALAKAECQWKGPAIWHRT